MSKKKKKKAHLSNIFSNFAVTRVREILPKKVDIKKQPPPRQCANIFLFFSFLFFSYPTSSFQSISLVRFLHK